MVPSEVPSPGRMLPAMTKRLHPALRPNPTLPTFLDGNTPPTGPPEPACSTAGPVIGAAPEDSMNLALRGGPGSAWQGPIGGRQWG